MLPKKFHLHLFIWFFVILSFIICAFFLILMASGYRLNLKAKVFEKTGLIFLNSDPRNASIYLNGKFMNKTPRKISYLRPGIYQIIIEKDGYKKWEKSQEVKADLVCEEKNIILFLENPKIEEVENKIETEIEKEDIDPQILENIGIKGEEIKDYDFSKDKEKLVYLIESEIWLYLKKDKTNKIVTRLSKPIKKILFYPDYSHLLFLSENKLRVIEIQGTNDTELLELSGEDFSVSKDGKEIYFQKEGKIMKVKIR